MLYIGIDIIGGQNHLAWSDDSTKSHRIEHFKSEQKLYERLRELVLQGGGMYEIAKSYYVFDGATNFMQDSLQFRRDLNQIGVFPKSLCLLPISIAVASSISLPRGNNIICHYYKRELITQTIKIENNGDINELITKHDEELGEDSIVRIIKDFMLQLYGVQISELPADNGEMSEEAQKQFALSSKADALYTLLQDTKLEAGHYMKSTPYIEK